MALIDNAVSTVAHLCEADVCLLVWRGPEGEEQIAVSRSEPEAASEAASWLDAVANRNDANGVVLCSDDVYVAPVFDPRGEPRGALALRPGPLAPPGDRLAMAAADHVNLLLSGSVACLDRSRAYQALFEIGTQIQAEESHPESIFALIVERARELLIADSAWMALMDSESGKLHIEVTAGICSPGFDQMKSAIGVGFGGMAIEERRTVAVADPSDYPIDLPAEIRRRLQAEGMVSLLCAPMLRGDGMLGALYVGTRSRRQFDDEEAHRLSALAAQPAVTIQNARLYADLSERNETLESSFSIHRRLTEAALSGRGRAGILGELCRLVDGQLLLRLDRDAPADALYDGDTDPVEPIELEADDAERLVGEAAASVAIVAGDDELGRIHLLGNGQLTALQLKALDHGATIIALELVKEQAEREVGWRLRGELLEELLVSEGAISESLEARADHFGVDLGVARRIAALAPTAEVTPSTLLDFVRRTATCHPGPRALVAQRGDRVLVAAADDGESSALGLIQLMMAKAERAGLAFRIGLSSAGTDFSIGLREATGALNLALAARGERLLVSYEDLGPLRFMLDAPDTSGMAALVREALEPLFEHDLQRRAELVSTLRNFLQCGGHQRSTAAACHIHVSTLKYRLGKISEILECDLNDAPTRFRLTLALEVLTLLDLAGGAPFEVLDRVPAADVQA